MGTIQGLTRKGQTYFFVNPKGGRMTEIIDVNAREILDSRGNPTVEVDVFLAGGAVAFSVAMTTLATFLSPVLTPLLVEWLGGVFLRIPFWPMMKTILLTVVLVMALMILAGLEASLRVAREHTFRPAAWLRGLDPGVIGLSLGFGSGTLLWWAYSWMVHPATFVEDHLRKHIVMMFRPALQAPFKVSEKPFVHKIRKLADARICQVRIREVRQSKGAVKIHRLGFVYAGFNHLIFGLLYKNIISRI